MAKGGGGGGGESSGARLLSGVLCGLSILPLEPPRPVSSALVVGVTVVFASTLLFDPEGREVLLVKLSLWVKGALMMVVGKDKKWKKKGRPDPSRVANAKDLKKKRLVLIRHGESEWNMVFNVGPKVLVPFKALMALGREIMMALRIHPGSVLYDSPLNESGLRQARELDSVFGRYSPSSPGAEDVDACRGGSTSTSVVVSSNLRRALQTVALALKSRFDKDPADKVVVLSALQEISTNIDTLSITPPFTQPKLTDVTLNEDRFDVAYNSGNKMLRGNGLQRMQAFAEWAFKRDEQVIIIGGHSLWFKYFFREFLPVNENPFNARDTKISNGGVVAITLERGTVEGSDIQGECVQYRIDPESVTEIYLGFEQKKLAKSKKKAQ